MDRSFLGFKQLLLRIINGPDQARPAAQPVKRVPTRPDGQVGDDWVRLEL
jgi:hypothetical protein